MLVGLFEGGQQCGQFNGTHGADPRPYRGPRARGRQLTTVEHSHAPFVWRPRSPIPFDMKKTTTKRKQLRAPRRETGERWRITATSGETIYTNAAYGWESKSIHTKAAEDGGTWNRWRLGNTPCMSRETNRHESASYPLDIRLEEVMVLRRPFHATL